MRKTFEGWDPRLTRMIAQLQTALKWKLCHCGELKSWLSGSVALLGDACHPTLPYQAQGAAMAVEDGLVLGVLLGKLAQKPELLRDSTKQAAIAEVLSLYERLRKSRTAVSVRGAISMQDFFHLADGEELARRDQILGEYSKSREWPRDCKWNWGDATYQQSLLGFDVVKNADEAFDLWRKARHTERLSTHMRLV